ncbi:MAG: poly(3-hydroxyalkanoate) depolymerase [Rhodospirillaceae bacterium]|nr:poly(3-hydroxyalkanoate) depolymerase [Rhodospirillaceae bacterium]MCA8933544.1 poly(3-hydroxyalkanoate) depolymerase [Rhodospirillaceae bacterium]
MQPLAIDMAPTKNPTRSPGTDLSIEMVEANGTPLRTATRPGSGERPPLVLLNGIGAQLEALSGFVNVLNPEIGVILFDIPGVGGSPKPTRPFRMSDMAVTMAALVEKLGHTQVDVFGVSWGGALAQQFAHTCPNHCRRLILGATAPSSMTIPRKPMAMMTMMNPMRFTQKDYVANNAMKMYGGKLRDDPTALGNLTEHMAGGAGSMGSVMYQMMALMGWTSLHWLHQLKQPTLVIAGKDDPIVSPTNAQTIANRIPNSRLEMVDCGHLFILTLAEEIAAMVDDFLGGPP